MAFAELKDGRIHYEVTGLAAGPVVILSNSLGTNLSMWDGQAPEFARNTRVLRYDTRGHGKSSATPGPYTFDQLGGDVLRLMDALKIARAAFCGLSMGGVTGMWLGIHAPERVSKLVLCSTGAKIGTTETWNARIAAVRKGGMTSIAAATMERWFTPRFRERSPAIVEGVKKMVEETNPDGYAACCGALRDFDLRESIGAIRTPALVISGTHDPATPASDGRFIAQRIPGARYTELDASHLSNIEQRDAFTQEAARFLESA